MNNQYLLKIQELLEVLIELQKKNATKQLPILTQKELLQQLKISPNTLKSWERKGLSRLEPPIENTRTVFYKISDVIDFLSK
ncbi:MerR family transcriptional regulator [Streptococcus suis]|uniref:MerR family transcriptional regulator n=1 Tax=Streptococcus suis TaxID=1307 RepID=UPI001551FF17|nr:MerR family transcriptional regulator [Streptococcus suis]MBY5010845.1 MerR family transcriptional regulator [Streptococcus suis]MDG4519214.1 MerR family transcriptional regulator [Streptococcus suis]NQL66871.1 MerR family transcriptional regulator [Streptococcus suis]NQM38098.1 MerR family transcriptional regulator [Streptococcus suis]UUM62952.1 MerR family transcriptional regulator [Streptococcus suis]